MIEIRNEIKPETKVEIVTPGSVYKVKLESFTTPDGTKLRKANPNYEIIIEHKNNLPINSMIRALK